jgi:hypothetical protein
MAVEMAEIVVKIPEKVELDTSELARGVEEFVKLRMMRDLLLQRLNELLKDSKLTEEDALELGRMVKAGRFERLKQMGLV